jgi:hypothetical protein
LVPSIHRKFIGSEKGPVIEGTSLLRRFFDHRLYDLLELGVDKYRGIREFAAAAASVQAGNKVCMQAGSLLSYLAMLQS